MGKTIKVTKEEEEFRRIHRHEIKSKSEDIKRPCTVCRIQLFPSEVQVHRVLAVTVCKKCDTFYNSGEFSTDEDGDQKYCTWCGQGGFLFFCHRCQRGAFCLECLKKNVTDKDIHKTETETWLCYLCDSKPIWKLRAYCHATISLVEQRKRLSQPSNMNLLEKLQDNFYEDVHKSAFVKGESVETRDRNAHNQSSTEEEEERRAPRAREKEKRPLSKKHKQIIYETDSGSTNSENMSSGTHQSRSSRKTKRAANSRKMNGKTASQVRKPAIDNDTTDSSTSGSETVFSEDSNDSALEKYTPSESTDPGVNGHSQSRNEEEKGRRAPRRARSMRARKKKESPRKKRTRTVNETESDTTDSGNTRGDPYHRPHSSKAAKKSGTSGKTNGNSASLVKKPTNDKEGPSCSKSEAARPVKHMSMSKKASSSSKHSANGDVNRSAQKATKPCPSRSNSKVESSKAKQSEPQPSTSFALDDSYRGEEFEPSSDDADNSSVKWLQDTINDLDMVVQKNVEFVGKWQCKAKVQILEKKKPMLKDVKRLSKDLYHYFNKCIDALKIRKTNIVNDYASWLTQHSKKLRIHLGDLSENEAASDENPVLDVLKVADKTKRKNEQSDAPIEPKEQQQQEENAARDELQGDESNSILNGPVDEAHVPVMEASPIEQQEVNNGDEEEENNSMDDTSSICIKYEPPGCVIYDRDELRRKEMENEEGACQEDSSSGRKTAGSRNSERIPGKSPSKNRGNNPKTSVEKPEGEVAVKMEKSQDKLDIPQKCAQQQSNYGIMATDSQSTQFSEEDGSLDVDQANTLNEEESRRALLENDSDSEEEGMITNHIEPTLQTSDSQKTSFSEGSLENRSSDSEEEARKLAEENCKKKLMESDESDSETGNDDMDTTLPVAASWVICNKRRRSSVVDSDAEIDYLCNLESLERTREGTALYIPSLERTNKRQASDASKHNTNERRASKNSTNDEDAGAESDGTDACSIHIEEEHGIAESTNQFITGEDIFYDNEVGPIDEEEAKKKQLLLMSSSDEEDSSDVANARKENKTKKPAETSGVKETALVDENCNEKSKWKNAKELTMPLGFNESPQDSQENDTCTDADGNLVIKAEVVLSPAVKKVHKRRRATTSISDQSSDDCDVIEIELSSDDEESGPEANHPGIPEQVTTNTKSKKRRILKHFELEASTQEAARDETERVHRQNELQKQYNKITKERGQNLSVPELVLEFNTETKRPVVEVHAHIASKLKAHQVKGVRFLWQTVFETIEIANTSSGTGCILAHCMGLGKTLQIVALAHTVLVHPQINIKTLLVVTPLSTVFNWEREFQSWTRGADNAAELKIYNFAPIKDVKERKDFLRRWHSGGGVMIISYGLYRSLVTSFDNEGNFSQDLETEEIFQKTLVNPGPDFIVCDEGHVLKNKNNVLSMAMSNVKTKRRIVLTGTPLQNSLMEYHCMMHFVKPNRLGNAAEFTNRFVTPIKAGQLMESSYAEVKLMNKRVSVLYRMLKPFVQRLDYNVLKPFLQDKFEYVVLVRLTELQKKLYSHFLEHCARGKSHKQKHSLFSDFQRLMTVQNHPFSFLVKKKNVKKTLPLPAVVANGELNGVPEAHNGEAPAEQVLSVNNADDLWWRQLATNEELSLLDAGNKMLLLFTILKECDMIGDKLLVFSQSLATLSMIEFFLKKAASASEADRAQHYCGIPGVWLKGKNYFRIDGETPIKSRVKWMKMFNNKDNFEAKLFLLTTRACGTGVNLVGANRVVLFDASWNPSNDMQAIFRVYRFGQDKPCYIYRFLASGAMEEKIYERQVNKLALSARVVDEHTILNHFSRADLEELYHFDPDHQNDQIPVFPNDRLLAQLYQTQKAAIVHYFEHDSLLADRPDEKLTEEEKNTAWEEYNQIEEEEKRQKIQEQQAKENRDRARISTNELLDSEILQALRASGTGFISTPQMQNANIRPAILRAPQLPPGQFYDPGPSTSSAIFNYQRELNHDKLPED